MSSGISKISYQTQVSLVSISQAPSDSKSVAKMLTALSDAEISIDMISQTAPRGSSISVSFSLSDEVLPRALAVLAKERSNQPELQSEVLPGNCKIAFYDANMVGTPGVAARVFSILAAAGVQICPVHWKLCAAPLVWNQQKPLPSKLFFFLRLTLSI